MIALFYSAKFGPAVELLRWICLGAALRVITWPLGFIVLAKGKQQLFFWSELAWTIVNVGLTVVCVSYFGLVGAGIAFFGSYVFRGSSHLLHCAPAKWLSMVFRKHVYERALRAFYCSGFSWVLFIALCLGDLCRDIGFTFKRPTFFWRSL